MCELDDTAFKDAKFNLQTVPGSSSTLLNVESPLLESSVSDHTTENNTLLAYLDQMDGLVNKIRSQINHNY